MAAKCRPFFRNAVMQMRNDGWMIIDWWSSTPFEQCLRSHQHQYLPVTSEKQATDLTSKLRLLWTHERIQEPVINSCTIVHNITLIFRPLVHRDRGMLGFCSLFDGHSQYQRRSTLLDGRFTLPPYRRHTVWPVSLHYSLQLQSYTWHERASRTFKIV